MLRRAFWILLVLALIVVNLVLFRGSYLYDQAKNRTSDIHRKIALLEMEQQACPVNDLLYHELAKSYFDAGVNRLNDEPKRNADFVNSYASYVRSLTLNPLSAVTHFDFAQALQYMTFLTPNARESYFEEYKKAALLSGQNIQIYTEVGKVFLSRWPNLTTEEKRFGLDIVRKVLATKEPDGTAAVLELWELNVGDYDVLEKILPADAETYFQTARYLRERSGDRNEILKYSSLAETLAFRAARDEFYMAQNYLASLKIAEAKARYESVLKDLTGIVFHQNLTSRTSIDAMEYENILKLAHLGRAKCIVEETRKLNAALDDLYAYLALEDQVPTVGELETFLRERGVIEATSSTNFQDFGRFAFELSLGYLQSRYREIVQAGQSLERSLLVIPDATRLDYARILELVGDSYRKLDTIYESNNFYQKAIDLGRQDIALYLKVRRNYERLNNPDKIKEIDRTIKGLLTFGEKTFPNLTLNKEEAFRQTLVLNGQKYTLVLSFGDVGPEPFPFIQILANGQVAWEDYLSKPELVLTLPSRVGDNEISVTAMNKPVGLGKMRIIFEERKTTPAGNEDISIK